MTSRELTPRGDVSMKAGLSRLIGTLFILLFALTPAQAQRYGLLLGLGPTDVDFADTSGDTELPAGPIDKFGTVWITIDGSEVHWMALRDIIIPRRDGFWHAGADLAVATRENERDTEVFLWAVPIGAERTRPKLDEPSCMDFHYSQAFTWISPNYVSVGAFRSAICAHYDENSDAYVLNLDGLMIPVSLDNLLEKRLGAEPRWVALPSSPPNVWHENRASQAKTRTTSEAAAIGSLRTIAGMWFTRMAGGSRLSCSAGKASAFAVVSRWRYR